MYEKTNALSPAAAAEHLREETRFLQACVQAREGRGASWEASVEGLQELARLRLCLDRAAELLAELQEVSGAPFPGVQADFR